MSQHPQQAAEFASETPSGVVLVVDDEPHIRRLVRVNLEHAGHQVIEAEDGVEGLEQTQERHPDLIVLDVMMPGMDGFEMLKRLRSDPATARIPVIMLTAKSQDADVFRGWQSGADSYLTKPFSPLEFLALVNRVLPLGGPQGSV